MHLVGCFVSFSFSLHAGAFLVVSLLFRCKKKERKKKEKKRKRKKSISTDKKKIYTGKRDTASEESIKAKERESGRLTKKRCIQGETSSLTS